MHAAGEHVAASISGGEYYRSGIREMKKIVDAERKLILVMLL